MLWKVLCMDAVRAHGLIWIICIHRAQSTAALSRFYLILIETRRGNKQNTMDFNPGCDIMQFFFCVSRLHTEHKIFSLQLRLVYVYSQIND